jgi:ribonuclease-3
MNVDPKIAEVERILKYVFVSKLLCAEAIQMAAPMSALSVNGRAQLVPENRRLAVLGDAIASSVLCKAWYSYRDQTGTFMQESSISSFSLANNPKGSPQTRAAWTSLRQGILNNETVAQLGRELGLDKTIVASAGHFGPPGTKMMATTVEALLGAVYVEGGEAAVSGVMAHIGLPQQLVMSKHLNPHRP